MRLQDAYELMEADLQTANLALREGWTLLAVSSASSPVMPEHLRTVYVLGRPMPCSAPEAGEQH